MFHSLRNRLIIINLAITTLVLIAAFSTIYMIAKASLDSRPLIKVGSFEYSNTVIEIMRENVIADRRNTLDSLLSSLITTGVIVELAVALASYFWAEAAIRPVQDAYESQKTFIANASHEIKTPLAAISANLEAADIQDNHWIDNVSREVQTLTRLNRDLLLLAQIDAQGSSTATSPISGTQDTKGLKSSKNGSKSAKTVALAPLLNNVLADFEARILAEKVQVDLSLTPTKPRLSLNSADFEQLFTILFDNALKYCDHQITIKYANHALSIKNDGQTISPDDLPHIFERFYQTDKSASGVGLGLAIASAIATRNGWKLIADSDQVSTTFTIEF